MQFTNAGDVICRTITIADDDIVEGTEEFSVTVTLPFPNERVELDNSSASITIVDTSRKKYVLFLYRHLSVFNARISPHVSTYEQHVCTCTCIIISVLNACIHPHVCVCRCSTWPGRSLHCQ